MNDYGLEWAETMRDWKEPPEPLEDFLPEEDDENFPEESD
jgi:hypothetical protein